jgi:tetratricopeptide (TPR) repeat protein
MLLKKTNGNWKMLFGALLLCVAFISPAFADDYEQAWLALQNNDRKTAKELFLKATKDPKRSVDAFVALIYLENFNNKSKEASPYFLEAFDKAEDAFPYLFALWFNEAALGDYGKKTKEQLKLMDKILNDPKANGSIKAALRYGKGMHYLVSNEFSSALKEWNMMGQINKWQFVGGFDNISGSGFDKNYPPIDKPEPKASFISANNAPIAWFTPAVINNDSWIFPKAFIKERDAVIFAQSFVNAPQDMEVIISAGFQGNIKVWVNDRLVISESEELLTELDMFKSVGKLKKGNNRILVQLGYDDSKSPNFIVRLVDKSFNPIPNLTYSDSYQPYPQDKGDYDPNAKIEHFAEVYFANKIKAEPNNLINYVLLCETYLRSKKVYEAQKVIDQAIKQAPENLLLRFELIQCYLKVNNRTDLLKEVENIKEKDPECIFALVLNLDQLMNEEKYEEAEALLEKRAKLYGENEDVLNSRIKLAINQNKIEDAVKLIEKGYSKYPDNSDFVNMWSNVQKKVFKNNQAGIRVNENYVKENFDVGFLRGLADDYIEQGMNNKGVKILESLEETFPYDPEYANSLLQYYYGTKNTTKALAYGKKQLALAPYHSPYWENLGLLYEQQGDKAEAIKAYKQGLVYNPNDFDLRRKIRMLENKEDLLKHLPNTNVYELLKASKTADKEGVYDWYYVVDEKAKIVYPEGIYEDYYTIAVKIVNEKGIDYWKEVSIPYNYYTQRLVVEKAEVVKKNGSKVKAEDNSNELIFTNLEIGDGVFIKYKLESYARGRLSKSFWDKFIFTSFVPVEKAQYTLLVANNIQFEQKLLNFENQPTIKEIGDFKLYNWGLTNQEALKDEDLMPPAGDVGKVLLISSLKDWQEIANWYSDVSSLQAKPDFEVKKLYQELFPTGQKFSEEEKARKIYDYIIKNIRYSSVSFRQSAHVPQKASKTLTTRLGDCKDLSTLYSTLAREAGLKANLVLLDTKDNGKQDLVLPSPDFNHCIVKVQVNNKPYYLELTDANLPFASLPPADIEALALEIPYNADIAKSSLISLTSPSKVPDQIKRTTKVSVDKNDLVLDVKTVRKGYLTSSTRYTYASLNKEKQMEQLKKSISNDYKNPITMLDANYTDLDKLADSLLYNYSYRVKNEIIEIGDMKTFKVPYADIFVRVDNFSEETRNFPINYWRYENTEEYLEDLTIQLAAGKQFVEVPKDLTADFNGIKYQLTFKKVSPTTVRVIRRVQIAIKDIAPEDYQKFKDFINTVVSAEAKYLAFK